MRISMILLICLAFSACSETDPPPIFERPEPTVPTITVANRNAEHSRHTTSSVTWKRTTSFRIGSDIPMPNTTYILVNDQLFRMDKGTTKVELFFEKTCPRPAIDDDDEWREWSATQPRFQAAIRPAHQRHWHLPYRRLDLYLPKGYEFNPYDVGSDSIYTGGLWCD